MWVRMLRVNIEGDRLIGGVKDLLKSCVGAILSILATNDGKQKDVRT